MRPFMLAPPLFALAVACSHGVTAQERARAPHQADQLAWGRQLYAEHCAKCHGDQGQGHARENAPPLVGQDALPLRPREGSKRKVDFHTAADVAGFAMQHMPNDAPGSLTNEEYYAILAFDLGTNGIDLGGKHLDAATAPSFVLHP